MKNVAVFIKNLSVGHISCTFVSQRTNIPVIKNMTFKFMHFTYNCAIQVI